MDRHHRLRRDAELARAAAARAAASGRNISVSMPFGIDLDAARTIAAAEVKIHAGPGIGDDRSGQPDSSAESRTMPA